MTFGYYVLLGKAFIWLLTWLCKDPVKVLAFPLVRPSVKYLDKDHILSLSKGGPEERVMVGSVTSERNHLGWQYHGRPGTPLLERIKAVMSLMKDWI